MLQRAINPAERWRGHSQPANTKKAAPKSWKRPFSFLINTPLPRAIDYSLLTILRPYAIAG
jgi:hypothetical protein